MAALINGAPEIVAHRRNTIEQLRETPRQYGVEVDIRSRGEDLIIHHDPFIEGVQLEAWLGEYRHGTLILNVKEEGLEQRLTSVMAGAGIEQYFFLDQSFPFLLRTARGGERRCAVRVSEYESVETALSVASLVDWVWVDLFTGALPSAGDLSRLKAAGLRLCLVSPELQGRDPAAEIPRLRVFLSDQGVELDAVCTKQPSLWE